MLLGPCQTPLSLLQDVCVTSKLQVLSLMQQAPVVAPTFLMVML
jgi:hypothetical protein